LYFKRESYGNDNQARSIKKNIKDVLENLKKELGWCI